MKYREMYEVYEDGRIYSHKTKRFLKGNISFYGYKIVCIHNKGTKLHRIIAECFVDNPDNKSMVNHKDGDKLNNHYTNLEWVTNSENMKHGWNTGLMKRGSEHGTSKYSDEQIHEICSLLTSGLSCQKIVDLVDFDITRDRILGIRSRRDWKHISEGYTWTSYK